MILSMSPECQESRKSRTTFISALLLVLASVFTAVHAAESAEMKVVRDFLDSWHSGDIDKIMGFFAADCYYANYPSLSGDDPVIKGNDKIRAFLTPFLRKDPLTVPFKFRTEVDNIVGGADGVALERHDVFDTGNLHHSVPVAGFFRVKSGKITYWVDYFDGAAFQPVTTIMTTYARK